MKLCPYIQEQYTDFSPFFPPIGGYAFFIDLLDFKNPVEGEFEVGKEKILLNQIIERETSITLAQEDKSRSETAVKGSLQSGEYYFKLKINKKIEQHKIVFKKSSIKSPVVSVRKEDNAVLVNWELKDSTNFWIFAIPDENYGSYSDFFEKLKPISKNRYTGLSFEIAKNPFGENIKYRVVVRANIEESVNSIPRFSKEAWGISPVIS